MNSEVTMHTTWGKR